MPSRNWLHILGPNVFRLLAPYVMVLWCLTRMSFGLTLGCSFVVNISFIQFGLRLLTVLKISLARTLNHFIFYFHCYFSAFSYQDIIIPVIIIKEHSHATLLDFLNFSDGFTSTKIPDQWTIIKICINKTIYNCNVFRFSHIFLVST